MDISLTDRETDLMEVLWERGPSTVAEVRDALSDDLAYTTVLTILRTLEEKGYVDHREEGRAHRYAATVARDVAQKSALKALSDKLFKGSIELLLVQLVSDDKLTDEEVSRIRRLLARRAKARKS
jgi:predicted transcriptional regulator